MRCLRPLFPAGFICLDSSSQACSEARFLGDFRSCQADSVGCHSPPSYELDPTPVNFSNDFPPLSP